MEDYDGSRNLSDATIIFGAIYMRGNPEPLSSSFINCRSADVQNICSELAQHNTTNLSLMEYEGGYYFLVNATQAGLTYIAVGTHSQDKGGDLKTLRSFLEIVRHKFEAIYGAHIRGEAPTDQLMSRGYGEFDKTIKDEGTRAMTDNQKHKTGQLVDHVMEVMIENMEKMVARHEKIEVICDDAISLKHSSMKFHKEASSAKKRMCWKNYRCWVYIGAAVLVVLLVILLIACDPNFSKCE